eukprot:TRINITY_DN91388_c0_g1_i1.p1 TRINITY_DN91388_c0_g1~~TRINITY_DN91388_c0_g1_i1.p1  ORF type:complete len:726 (-),score=201.65 TRINITY_DN91388_c0_g1_i1:63-2240(-)
MSKKKGDSSTAACLKQAEAQVQRGEFDDAVKNAESVVDGGTEEQIQQALLIRSRAFHCQGRHAKAFDEAELAIGRGAKSADAAFRRGICLDALGYHEAAVDALAEASGRLAAGGSSLRAEECETASARAARHLKEQSTGAFDWKALYKSAESLPAGSDGGPVSFCHPSVAVRASSAAAAGRGRGLVLTGDVSEGELLFACRAYAMASQATLPEKVAEQYDRSGLYERLRLMSLYDGENADAEVKEHLNICGRPASGKLVGSEGPRCDAKTKQRIKKILKYNTHAQDMLNAHGASEEHDKCGLWILPSFLNHSCRPNVQRTYLGDMMICRAATALPSGTELVDTYVSPFQALKVRRERLRADFDFECRCGRCVLEEEALPSEASSALLRKLDAVVERIGERPDWLKDTATAFDGLVEEAFKLASKGVEVASERLKRGDGPVQKAVQELFGAEALSGRGFASESSGTRVQRLLCSPFVSIFKGAAFVYKQMEDPVRSAKAYEQCLQVLEEASPGSAYHGHWAAERALQAHLAAKLLKTPEAEAAVASAVKYCRRWHAISCAPEAFELEMERLKWPSELLAMSAQQKDVAVARQEGGYPAAEKKKKPAASAPPAAAAADAAPPSSTPAQAVPAAAAAPSSSAAWTYTLDEQDGSFQLSISVPDDVEPSELDLDVGRERVVVVCNAGGAAGALGTLHVALSRSVDPDSAPPVKFKKKGGRRLLLELPFA